MSIYQGTPVQPGLYAVYLGGESAPGRFSEDHEVVFVVATGAVEARALAKKKWQGRGRAHTDATRLIDVVDGYRIELRVTEEAERIEVDTTYEE